MHRNIPLVVGITILFLGLSIQPTIAVNPISTDNEEDCSICPMVSKLKELGKYQKLFDRIINLKEMNKELKIDSPLRYHIVICSILTIISIPVLLSLIIFELVLFKYPHYLERPIFAGIVAWLGLVTLPLTLLILILVEVFECI